MTNNEAKTAYIIARKNYQSIIAQYDRSQREARFQAYAELKAAQIDLIDLGFDDVEIETGQNLSKELALILSDPSAREECCENIF